MKSKNKCCGLNLGSLAKKLKIISEDTRLKIICLIKKSPKCVCEIQEALNLSHNLVCHHLKELDKIGIVKSKKKNKYTFYRLNNMVYKKFIKNLNQLLGGNL